jgi:hypothetical protein
MVITIFTQHYSSSTPTITNTVPLSTAHIESIHIESTLDARPTRARATLSLPKRYTASHVIEVPPSMDEIRANMTLYLHTLHRRLGDLAGPKVQPSNVWETFLEVTKAMPMVWDEANRYYLT